MFLLFVNVEFQLLGTIFLFLFLIQNIFALFNPLALFFVVLITLFSLTEVFLTGGGKSFSTSEVVVLLLSDSSKLFFKSSSAWSWNYLFPRYILLTIKWSNQRKKVNDDGSPAVCSDIFLMMHKYCFIISFYVTNWRWRWRCMYLVLNS